MLFEVFGALELVNRADYDHSNRKNEIGSGVVECWDKTGDSGGELSATGVASQDNNGWTHDADGDSANHATNNYGDAKGHP